MRTLTDPSFQILKSFLDRYRPLSLREVVKSFPETNYLVSFPVIALYYDLLRFLERRSVVFFDGLVCLLEKKTLLLYGGEYDLSGFEGWTVKSAQRLPFKGGRKYVETLYCLDQVLDPSSYPKRKHRKKKLLYPLRRAEREGVEIRDLGEEWLVKAVELSERWEEYKVSSGKVYVRGFPKGEFRRMAERFFLLRKLGIVNGYMFGVFVKEKPYYIGIDVFLSPETVYGVAGFSLSFDFDRSFGNEAFLLECAFLHERGHRRLNVGFSTDKTVREFKEKWVHESRVSYQYRI